MSKPEFDTFLFPVNTARDVSKILVHVVSCGMSKRDKQWRATLTDRLIELKATGRLLDYVYWLRNYDPPHVFFGPRRFKRIARVTALYGRPKEVCEFIPLLPIEQYAEIRISLIKRLLHRPVSVWIRDNSWQHAGLTDRERAILIESVKRSRSRLLIKHMIHPRFGSLPKEQEDEIKQFLKKHGPRLPA